MPHSYCPHQACAVVPELQRCHVLSVNCANHKVDHPFLRSHQHHHHQNSQPAYTEKKVICLVTMLHCYIATLIDCYIATCTCYQLDHLPVQFTAIPPSNASLTYCCMIIRMEVSKSEIYHQNERKIDFVCFTNISKLTPAKSSFSH